MTPATYNFSVVRGTSGPTQGLVVQLKAQSGLSLVNIPYQDVRLSIYDPKGRTLILRASLSGGSLIESDLANAEITWAPTAAQTRLIPIGDKASYELEVRNAGTEIVYMLGTITGIGGLNDDEVI
jgi:hypothetical protein